MPSLHLSTQKRRISSNRQAVPTTIIAVYLLFFLNACSGQKADPQGMGPLTEHLFPGEVEGWSGSMEQGIYWLANEAKNPNDIRYFYTAIDDEPTATRTVSVDILTRDMGPNARAGLLYGYQDSPRFYYLIVASSNLELDIYQRNGDRFQLSQSSSIDSAGNGIVSLELNEKGRQLTITANGRTVSSLENDFIGNGQLGIAAFGLGRFGFTNYTQHPMPKQALPTSPKVNPLDRQPQASNPLNQNPLSRNPLNQNPSPTQPTVRTGLNLLEFMDRETGMVQYRAPFPSGWKVDQNPDDQLTVTGPGQTEVYQTSSGQFIYSDDPFARESATIAGGQVAQPIPVEQYLQQVYRPYMEQRGFKMSSSYPLPKIQDFWELFSAGMPQGLSRRSYQVLGADWETQNGTQACTVMVMNVLQNQPYTMWSVWVGELYAPGSVFETNKDAYLYASAETVVNPQWQITKNQPLIRQIQADRQIADERMRQSSIQHLNRMNSILARSESNSSIAKINSDILDISHSGYLKRSDMVSAGQSNTINMIGEHAIIGNPTTGERYQVDARPGNYWVNAQGEFFSTENRLYDPQADNSINQEQWTQFEVMR